MRARTRTLPDSPPSRPASPARRGGPLRAWALAAVLLASPRAMAADPAEWVPDEGPVIPEDIRAGADRPDPSTAILERIARMESGFEDLVKDARVERRRREPAPEPEAISSWDILPWLERQTHPFYQHLLLRALALRLDAETQGALQAAKPWLLFRAANPVDRPPVNPRGGLPERLDPAAESASAPVHFDEFRAEFLGKSLALLEKLEHSPSASVRREALVVLCLLGWSDPAAAAEVLRAEPREAERHRLRAWIAAASTPSAETGEVKAWLARCLREQAPGRFPLSWLGSCAALNALAIPHPGVVAEALPGLDNVAVASLVNALEQSPAGRAALMARLNRLPSRLEMRAGPQGNWPEAGRELALLDGRDGTAVDPRLKGSPATHLRSLRQSGVPPAGEAPLAEDPEWLDACLRAAFSTNLAVAVSGLQAWLVSDLEGARAFGRFVRARSEWTPEDTEYARRVMRLHPRMGAAGAGEVPLEWMVWWAGRPPAKRAQGHNVDPKDRFVQQLPRDALEARRGRIEGFFTLDPGFGRRQLPVMLASAHDNPVELLQAARAGWAELVSGLNLELLRGQEAAWRLAGAQLGLSEALAAYAGLEMRANRIGGSVAAYAVFASVLHGANVVLPEGLPEPGAFRPPPRLPGWMTGHLRRLRRVLEEMVRNPAAAREFPDAAGQLARLDAVLAGLRAGAPGEAAAPAAPGERSWWEHVRAGAAAVPVIPPSAPEVSVPLAAGAWYRDALPGTPVLGLTDAEKEWLIDARLDGRSGAAFPQAIPPADFVPALAARLGRESAPERLIVLLADLAGVLSAPLDPVGPRAWHVPGEGLAAAARSPDLAPRLRALTAHAHPVVRAGAVAALALSGETLSTAEFAALAADSSPEVAAARVEWGRVLDPDPRPGAEVMEWLGLCLDHLDPASEPLTRLGALAALEEGAAGHPLEFTLVALGRGESGAAAAGRWVDPTPALRLLAARRGLPLPDRPDTAEREAILGPVRAVQDPRVLGRIPPPGDHPHLMTPAWWWCRNLHDAALSPDTRGSWAGISLPSRDTLPFGFVLEPNKARPRLRRSDTTPVARENPDWLLACARAAFSTNLAVATGSLRALAYSDIGGARALLRVCEPLLPTLTNDTSAASYPRSLLMLHPCLDLLPPGEVPAPLLDLYAWRGPIPDPAAYGRELEFPTPDQLGLLVWNLRAVSGSSRSTDAAVRKAIHPLVGPRQLPLLLAFPCGERQEALVIAEHGWSPALPFLRRGLGRAGGNARCNLLAALAALGDPRAWTLAERVVLAGEFSDNGRLEVALIGGSLNAGGLHTTYPPEPGEVSGKIPAAARGSLWQVVEIGAQPRPDGSPLVGEQLRTEYAKVLAARPGAKPSPAPPEKP